jgi:hypothetical protein
MIPNPSLLVFLKYPPWIPVYSDLKNRNAESWNLRIDGPYATKANHVLVVEVIEGRQSRETFYRDFLSRPMYVFLYDDFATESSKRNLFQSDAVLEFCCPSNAVEKLPGDHKTQRNYDSCIVFAPRGWLHPCADSFVGYSVRVLTRLPSDEGGVGNGLVEKAVLAVTETDEASISETASPSTTKPSTSSTSSSSSSSLAQSNVPCSGPRHGGSEHHNYHTLSQLRAIAEKGDKGKRFDCW